MCIKKKILPFFKLNEEAYPFRLIDLAKLFRSTKPSDPKLARVHKCNSARRFFRGKKKK